jgi:cyclase
MKAAQLLAGVRVSGGRLVPRRGEDHDADALRLVDELTAAGATGIALMDQSQGPAELDETLALLHRLRRERPDLVVSAGGGVAGLEDVGRLLQAGANRAIIGAAALGNPELLHQAVQRFGADGVAASMEVRLERRRGEETIDLGGDRTLLVDTETTGGWYRVYVRGGSTATTRDAISWATECAGMGVGELVVASIDPSGEASHYDLELIGRITEATATPVFAAGPMPSAETAIRLFTLAGGAGVVLLDAAMRAPADLSRLRDDVGAAGVTFAGGEPRRESPQRPV